MKIYGVPFGSACAREHVKIIRETFRKANVKPLGHVRGPKSTVFLVAKADIPELRYGISYWADANDLFTYVGLGAK